MTKTFFIKITINFINTNKILKIKVINIPGLGGSFVSREKISCCLGLPQTHYIAEADWFYFCGYFSKVKNKAYLNNT